MGKSDMQRAVLSTTDANIVQSKKKSELDDIVMSNVMEAKAKNLMNKEVIQTLPDGTVVQTTAWEEMLKKAYQNDMNNPKLSGKDLLAWKDLAGEKKKESVDVNLSLVDLDLQKGALD